MFSIFKKKSTDAPITDLSTILQVDMHNHLLPGLDDGVQTMTETLNFLQQMQALGYKKLICTPHIYNEVHNNTPETILPTLQKVQQAATAQNIDIMLEAAAEYMVDNYFEELVNSKQPLLTMGGNKKLILIEMSFAAASHNILQVVYNLCLQGYTPILAHPERYSYYHNIEVYQQFINRGCYLQLNLLSLQGYYGKETKKMAEKLLKHKMISFLGTDMHHTGHLEKTKELLDSSYLKKIVAGNNIINNILLQ